MKKAKLLLVAAAFAVTNIAVAQKGGILIGGNFGINSEKNTTDFDGHEESVNVMTTTFSPVIGYNISDKFMAGLWFEVSAVKTTMEEDGEDDEETKSSNFGIGPFFRYTKSLGDIFSLYGQANIGIRVGKTEEQGIVGYNPLNGDPIYGTIESSSFGFLMNIFPAVGVNIGSGWGLNFSFGGLGINSTVSEPDDSEADISQTNSEFNFSLNPQMNIGISKTFGGGSK